MWPLEPCCCLLQVGPCTGIDSPDQLWMARFLLYRIAELYNVEVGPGSLDRHLRIMFDSPLLAAGNHHT